LETTLSVVSAVVKLVIEPFDSTIAMAPKKGGKMEAFPTNWLHLSKVSFCLYFRPYFGHIFGCIFGRTFGLYFGRIFGCIFGLIFGQIFTQFQAIFT
jgi:hypothetical protein